MELAQATLNVNRTEDFDMRGCRMGNAYRHLRRGANRLRRATHIALPLLIAWTVSINECLAQVPKQETKEKGYIPIYLIIVLAVGGSLTLVCRSTRRFADVKPRD